MVPHGLKNNKIIFPIIIGKAQIGAEADFCSLKFTGNILVREVNL
jgi:hypothetical protein